MSSSLGISGVNNSTLIGRGSVVTKILRRITKETPDQLTIVGPKSIGKTMLVDRLKSDLQQDPTYAIVFYWDLKKKTPDSDQEFWKYLFDLLRNEIREVDEAYIDGIDPNSEDIQEDLDVVLQMLDSDGIRTLLIFDHFDEVIGKDISANVWTILRSQSQRDNHFLMTVSQKTLRQISQIKALSDSKFHEVFDPNPVRIGVIEEKEIKDWIKPFTDSGLAFESGAQKELMNWSGGLPILLKKICDEVHVNRGSHTTIKKAQIDDVANQILSDEESVVGILWDNVDPAGRSSIILFNEEKVNSGDIPLDVEKDLERRGYLRKDGKRLTGACRLMSEYGVRHGKVVTDIRRIFGSQKNFDKNIREVLALRLARIEHPDQRLRLYVETAINALDNDPKICLQNAREFRDVSLSLIWEAEFGGNKIPDELIEHWETKIDIERAPYWYKNIRKNQAAKVPDKEVQQLSLLDWLTGNQNLEKRSRYVSKETYTQLEHAHHLGNYASHKKNTEPSFLLAVMTCFCGLILLGNISRELPK